MNDPELLEFYINPLVREVFEEFFYDSDLFDKFK